VTTLGAGKGAWVADITGLLDLDSWPAGMRVIVRKERPHPGAQLRHRRRARCEDRIRNTNGTPPTRRHSRADRHRRDPKSSARPAPRATTSWARKIEARLYQSEAKVDLVYWKYVSTLPS